MIHEKIDVSVDETAAHAYTYILDNTPEVNIRPMVIICPGGGYEYISAREAEPIALAFNAKGLHAIILHYSVTQPTFPAALFQLSQVMRIARSRAAQWHLDAESIIVAGFSAGGHLAASLGVLWNKGLIDEKLGGTPADYRPNGLMLCYPVITSNEFGHQGSISRLFGDDQKSAAEYSLEKQVDENTPPTFLWHTCEDTQVLVENTLIFAAALRTHKVDFEMHVYQHGGHGLSLGTGETGAADAYANVPGWVDLAAEWVRTLFREK